MEFWTNNLPLVSIIIVNFNGKKYLEKCLESLLKINYSNYEIIVIDNNSTDGSVEFIEKNHSQIIIKKLEKNYGFAYPNNLGAKIAKGEFLLFLNNDTKVCPDFVIELMKTITSSSDIGICQSYLLKMSGDVDSSGDFMDIIGISFSSKEKISEVRDIFSAKGASLMIKKLLFEELNGFDEDFFVSFEDVDLSWRCWILGYRVVVAPDSIVYHYGSSTIKKLKRNMTFHGLKNQLSMKITNFEPNYTIRNIPLFFLLYGFRELKILCDYKLKGLTKVRSTKYENVTAAKPNLKEIICALVWILKNITYLRRKQKLVNSKRLYSTKELIKRGIIIKSF